MIKKHIPNAITCANLFAGCVGIEYAFKGDLKTAAYLVVLAAVFDFLDGTFARILNVKSAIGKELDSLADVISFGLLPSVVMYQLLASSTAENVPYLKYLGFFIAVFSAVRLAKFNVDTQQTEDFIGLNVPTNALLIVSLPFVKHFHPETLAQPWLLIGITVISCFLLNSKLKLFSLKLNQKGWKPNRFKIIFVILTGVLVAMLNFVAVPIVLLLYIILSTLHFKINK